MSNDLNHIINKMKAKSKKFSLPVEEHVWDSIEKSISPPKKKNAWLIPFLKYTFTLLIIGFSIFGINSYFKEITDKEIAYTKDFSNQFNQSTTTSEKGKAATQKNTTASSPRKIAKTNHNSETVETTLPAKKTVNNNVNDNNTIQKEKNINPNFFKQKESKAISSKVNNKVNTIISSEKTNVKNLITSTQKEIILQHNSELINDQRANRSKTSINNHTARSNEKFTEETTFTKKEKVITTSIDTLIKAPSNPSVVSNNNTSSIDTNQSEIYSKSTNQQFSPFSLLIFFGGGGSYRNLSSDVHSELINHKNNQDNYGLVNDIGLSLQYSFTNHSYFRLGMTYKSYSEKYAFTHDIISHATSNNYNYFQSLIGYGQPFFIKKKHRLFIQGGFKWNLLSTAKSSWVDPELLEVVEHSNSDNNQPFQNNTYAFFGGLDYQFAVNESLAIHLMPTYDQFLKSIYQSTTEINQRPYSIVLNFGISYRFK